MRVLAPVSNAHTRLAFPDRQLDTLPQFHPKNVRNLADSFQVR
jgi:hypothetical protein